VLLVAAGNSTTGGGEKHVADLLRGLPRGEFELALACPDGGDLGDLARDLGIPVFALPIDRGFSLGRLRSLREAIAATSADVVHAHGSRAAAFARAADRESRHRVVYTVHGIHVANAGSPARCVVLTSVERLLRRRTARFVTVCDSDAAKGDRLGVLVRRRTVTIHNGIQLPPAPAAKGRFRTELQLGPETPLVLSVGRLHEQKDHATLLRAWRRVAHRHPGAMLAIVGSGPLDDKLRAIATAEGLSGAVRFVEPRAHLAEAYVDADLFTLSSRWEGLPYVLLEAMAYGVPIVSTAVDGIPEVVTDNESGLLVPAQDSKALAQALDDLLSNPDRRRALGESGRAQVAEGFSVGRMILGLAEVYREVARS
jgi:glycosyltransferase involved in cell wall biosynthesis